jgi:electron transport complex protein RnfG
MPYEGNGFQGNIRIMFGVNEELNKVTGLEVLEQVETPGLGTKITEEPFIEQFDELVTEPQVDWVKGAPPSNPNEIQTITGATISSKAIVTILNAGIEQLRSATGSGGKL